MLGGLGGGGGGGGADDKFVILLVKKGYGLVSAFSQSFPRVSTRQEARLYHSVRSSWPLHKWSGQDDWQCGHIL